MAKRVTPIEKAARLLDLVPYIYSHQGISVEALAKEFSITTQELLSDLNVLWMCGESRFDLIELEFESGFVYIRNAQAINMVRTLSIQEVTAILFGLDLLKESISGHRSDLVSEIEAIKEKLGEPVKRSVATEPKITGELMLTIDHALLSRLKLKIDYHSVREDLVSTRVIHPIEKQVINGVESLLAFCESADGHRTFRFDRIRTAELVPEAAIKRSKISESSAYSVVVKVHSDHRRVTETLGPIRDNRDGSYLVEIYSHAWLIREVIAAAGAIEVVEPAELRAEIKRQAALVAAQYR
jgi:proteasome accessory factor C